MRIGYQIDTHNKGEPMETNLDKARRSLEKVISRHDPRLYHHQREKDDVKNFWHAINYLIAHIQHLEDQIANLEGWIDDLEAPYEQYDHKLDDGQIVIDFLCKYGEHPGEIIRSATSVKAGPIPSAVLDEGYVTDDDGNLVEGYVRGEVGP